MLSIVEEPGQTGHLGLPCSVGVSSVDREEPAEWTDSALTLHIVEEPGRTDCLELPFCVGVWSAASRESRMLSELKHR